MQIVAHRFSDKYGRKIPKPSASERTWSRWRMRKNIQTKQDEVRKSRIEEIKEKALERFNFLKALKKQKEKKKMPEKGPTRRKNEG